MKCIVSDMDGTLLNENQKISEENRKALEAVREMGGQVIIATGRSYKEARLALDEANINCPIISMNGAAVYDQKGDLISSQPIALEELESTITFLEEAGLSSNCIRIMVFSQKIQSMRLILLWISC